MKHVVGVSAGTGLGAGIIINHHLFNGNNCGRENWIVPYLDHNIEYYASGNLFRAVFNTTAEEAHHRAALGTPKPFAIGMNSEFIWLKR
jgi:glucokinase